MTSDLDEDLKKREREDDAIRKSRGESEMKRGEDSPIIETEQKRLKKRRIDQRRVPLSNSLALFEDQTHTKTDSKDKSDDVGLLVGHPLESGMQSGSDVLVKMSKMMARSVSRSLMLPVAVRVLDGLLCDRRMGVESALTEGRRIL